MGELATRYGPWALVTGASSGIGREFAARLAAEGLDLLLVARSREKLEALARELAATHGVEAVAVPADLARPDFMAALEPALAGRPVGLLVNNAGAAVAGELRTNDLARELAILDLNCRAPLILTRSLAPAMAERGRGGIVFVSSVLGLMPMPYLANYSATKAYDLFLGEALWYELGAQGIDVTTLCPGATRTGFGDAAGFGPSEGMAVGPVVAEALAALGRRPAVVAGLRNRLMAGLARLLPLPLRLRLLGRIGRGMVE